MKRNETSEEQKSKREENRSETKNYLISNQCFHKQKTKEKQVTTASFDLDLQILTKDNQINKRNKHPAKTNLKFVEGLFLLF
jgi:hypothetical protein